MKAYKKIIYTILIGLTVLLTSTCTSGFKEINKDPNRPSEVPTTGILAQVLREIAYNYYDSWQGLRMNGVISQQWVQRTYTEEDRYDFGARTGTVANFFNLAYRTIELANQIVTINEANPELASAYGDNKAQIATVRIIRAWLIFQNAETFGDVPYTEANDIFTYPTPKYDKQDFIYKDLIRELKEVNTSLQGVTKGWTAGDVIFKGNVDKWRRFANSTRLLIAMRMSNFDPAYSATEADAAIADGVMESNADNAVFRFVSAGSPNESSKYNTFLSRMDFLPSWQFVNLLHGRDDDNIGFKNPFNGIMDPRFIQFVQSPADQSAGVTPRIDAVPIGLSNSDNDQVFLSYSTATRITYGPTSGKADNTLPKPIQAVMWSTLLDYPNVAFLIAERRGNDRDMFEKGVKASLGIWGIPDTDAAAYLTAVMDKFDAADAEKKFEMIITQKYIHNFAHFDQESLFEYRRTEFPKSVVLPGQKTGGTFVIGGVEKTYQFTPLTGSTIIMQRHLYPTTEATTNLKNLQDAIGSMGGDSQDIPLIYSKKYKK